MVLGLTVGSRLRSSCGHRLLALVDGGVVLVESMSPPGVEMLVSATRDGVVPALVIGLGGIWTELLSDVAVIPLPADTGRIRAGIEQLRGYALLSGGRGQADLAVDALCELAEQVGQTLLDAQLSLIEINPVMVNTSTAVALDAVIQR